MTLFLLRPNLSTWVVKRLRASIDFLLPPFNATSDIKARILDVMGIIWAATQAPASDDTADNPQMALFISCSRGRSGAPRSQPPP
jgi:hypothetical protein